MEIQGQERESVESSELGIHNLVRCKNGQFLSCMPAVAEKAILETRVKSTYREAEMTEYHVERSRSRDWLCRSLFPSKN